MFCFYQVRGRLTIPWFFQQQPQIPKLPLLFHTASFNFMLAVVTGAEWIFKWQLTFLFSCVPQTGLNIYERLRGNGEYLHWSTSLINIYDIFVFVIPLRQAYLKNVYAFVPFTGARATTQPPTTRPPTKTKSGFGLEHALGNTLWY